MARLELVAAINGTRPMKARAPARTVPVPIPPGDEDRKDHFITRNGLTYAGSHLIIDLWDAEFLDDRDRIEQALVDAVNVPSPFPSQTLTKELLASTLRFASARARSRMPSPLKSPTEIALVSSIDGET